MGVPPAVGGDMVKSKTRDVMPDSGVDDSKSRPKNLKLAAWACAWDTA
jgi:hypothetical protein